jgi:DNA polymerase III subunit delta'
VSGFADIIGHEMQIEALRQAMRQKKVAHAFLFAGPEGVGKHLVARAFAAALACRTMDDDACGACTSCHKLQERNHPDVIEVQKGPPTVKGKDPADEKEYRVARIRELAKASYMAPYDSAYKVFILDNAEAINPAAANAFLKTLEEPRPYCVFILVTAMPHALLPTIVSRCRTVRFGLLPDAVVADWSRVNLGVEDDQAELIAGLAEGSLGRAAALDLEFLTGPRLRLFEEVVRAAEGKTAARLKLADTLLDIDPGLVDGIDLLAGFIRDALVWRETGEAGRIRNRDVCELVGRLADRMSAEALAGKVRSLVHARRLVQRNVAKQAIAAALCLDLLSAEPTRFAQGRLPR